MIIVTGGRYNGKLDYVISELGFKREDVLDLSGLTLEEALSGMREHSVIYHLESFIREFLSTGLDYISILDDFASMHPDCAIICDEVGSGIIPMDLTEEKWREEVGRIMCRLAGKAGYIIRVSFGVAERIGHGGGPD